MLRAAREKAGLSLDDVAARTKVRPGILTAIEEDRHDHLPALTYTLGFVKAYARTVGLDPQLAADRYRQESHKGDPVPSIVDLEPLDTGRLPSRGLAAAGLAAVVVGVAAFWAWGAGLFGGEVPPEPRVAANGEAPADSPAAAAAPVPAPAAEPAPPPPGPVVLVAREEVWLRVDNRETGARFFEGTLAAGQELAIPPGEPLQLRTGRAGALEVRVGADVLPPLGGPVERVRGVSLVPEDLRQRAARPAPRSAGLPVPGLAEAPPVPGL